MSCVEKAEELEEDTDFAVSREIRGDVDELCEDDAKTVVNGHAQHDDCSVEDSTSEDSPTETSRPGETGVPWDDDDKTIIVTAKEHDSHTIANSRVEESPTNTPLLNGADEIDESCQDECNTPVDESKVHEAPVTDSPLPETHIGISISSPMEASSPTWAEVVASPTKTPSCGAKALEIWGAVSGKDWERERKWRG
jgi:hypothetical protein